MIPALTTIDYAALSPLLILLSGALLILFFESFTPFIAKRFSASIAILSLLTALFAAYFAPISENPLLTPWLNFDPLARFFTIFFLLIGLGSTLLAASFFKKFEATRGEYFFLLLSSIFGLILIGTAADFLTLFLGVETLSISLYVLCGYMKKWKFSHEASAKYFLMGSLATAFLLYGIALIYGAVGSTSLGSLLSHFQAISTAQNKVLFLSGVAFVTVGLAFEAALVPFHLWAPDAYDGAPTPVTAFMSVGTKVGAFAAFVRVFLISLPNFDLVWNEGVALLAYSTLIYANYLALRQQQMRRFFAYSGISHAGFLLLPLAAGTAESLQALLLYLVIYVLATMGSFAVLAILDEREEGVTLGDLRGLFKRSPALASFFGLCLLTLAGIPPTAGFIAKFFVFKVAFEAGYYGLVIVGLLTTILSAYYYLRIISVMLAEKSDDVTSPRVWPAAAVSFVSLVGIALLSLYPEPFINLLKGI
jgi:NADH-quinone oxidoreductase subunit N